MSPVDPIGFGGGSFWKTLLMWRSLPVLLPELRPVLSGLPKLGVVENVFRPRPQPAGSLSLRGRPLSGAFRAGVAPFLVGGIAKSVRAALGAGALARLAPVGQQR